MYGFLMMYGLNAIWVKHRVPSKFHSIQEKICGSGKMAKFYFRWFLSDDFFHGFDRIFVYTTREFLYWTNIFVRAGIFELVKKKIKSNRASIIALGSIQFKKTIFDSIQTFKYQNNMLRTLCHEVPGSNFKFLKGTKKNWIRSGWSYQQSIRCFDHKSCRPSFTKIYNALL